MTNFTLQLLHIADGEAGLLAAKTAPKLAALVDAFDNSFTNTLILSGGDNFIPSPFLSAGSDPSLNTLLGTTALGRADIAIHNAIGIQASGIGNHEWDLGSAVFADAVRSSGNWVGAQFALLTANLDFTNDSAVRALADASLGGSATNAFTNKEITDLKGKIAPSAVLTMDGGKVGIVGATTQLIENISSPSGTEVKGFPFGLGPNGERDDMDLLAAQLQPVIDGLIAQGINKIVLISHLQQISNEQLLASKLKGVDIILAAGSNTRLGDTNDIAVAFPGHAASFEGSYPISTVGADGKPLVIVNTDNEYTYLGRLVVDFDANGEVISDSISANSPINGAYAATDVNVAKAWGVTEAELSGTAFAAGTKGAAVSSITNAVQSVINAKDGSIFGYTDVYLEGERSFVRGQETNLGNLTADANALSLKNALTGTAEAEFIVSFKNGGGIRAQIGSVSSAGGSSEKLPPTANPDTGKTAGGVSLLDVENSLRFDNKLMTFETDAAGLKVLLENGVTSWPNQGRFAQVGGISFSWKPDQPAGSRISDISLIDATGNVTLRLYDDGVLQAGIPNKFQVVTLNFLANGGDGYSSKQIGENFRFLLDNGKLSAVVDEAADFSSASVISSYTGSSLLLGEQQALREYMQTFHATKNDAFDVRDTIEALDTRIQNLSTRSDTVLKGTVLDTADRLVYSAYDIAFNRRPDEPGYVFWANNLASGNLTSDKLMENFLKSNEFTASGAPVTSTTQFVEKLYANALDRSAEIPGLAYWTRVIDENVANRTEVAFAFINSAEHAQLIGADFTSASWLG